MKLSALVIIRLTVHSSRQKRMRFSPRPSSALPWWRAKQGLGLERVQSVIYLIANANNFIFYFVIIVSHSVPVFFFGWGGDMVVVYCPWRTSSFQHQRQCAGQVMKIAACGKKKSSGWVKVKTYSHPRWRDWHWIGKRGRNHTKLRLPQIGRRR